MLLLATFNQSHALFSITSLFNPLVLYATELCVPLSFEDIGAKEVVIIIIMSARYNVCPL